MAEGTVGHTQHGHDSMVSRQQLDREVSVQKIVGVHADYLLRATATPRHPEVTDHAWVARRRRLLDHR